MSRTRSTASLKRAVKNIPSLIMQEKASQSSHNTPTDDRRTTSQKQAQVYHSPLASRRSMVAGIVGCVVIIMGFWIVYMTNLVRAHGFSFTSASAITMAPRDEFEAVMASFSMMEDQIRQNMKSKQDIEIMVSDALEPLLAIALSQEQSTSTDAVTDTEDATTTSTVHIATNDSIEVDTSATSTNPVHTE